MMGIQTMQAEVQIKKGFTITPQNYYVYLHIKEDVGGEVACKVSNLVFTTSSVTAVAAPETP